MRTLLGILGLLTIAAQAPMPAIAQTASIAAAPAAAVPVAAGTAAVATPNDYRLGIADQVRVSVYNEPDLSGQFAVNANGMLSLPLIGDVSVAGRTAGEVGREVERRLADGYLRDPHVSLEVLTFRPFYILGEVTSPGEYPYSSGLTVLNAVATAKGFTYRANKKRVFLKHSGSDKEISTPLRPDLQIEPGDTIRIGERYF